MRVQWKMQKLVISLQKGYVYEMQRKFEDYVLLLGTLVTNTIKFMKEKESK